MSKSLEKLELHKKSAPLVYAHSLTRLMDNTERENCDISVQDLIYKKRKGSYYTKPEIVSLILDLAGYTSDRLLHKSTLLEPSAGEGAFLIEAVKRLISAAMRYSDGELFTDENLAFDLLRNAICSIELNSMTYHRLRSNINKILRGYGASEILCRHLLDQWIVQTDFLLWNKPVERRFDYIIGNPPYVRIENLDETMAKEYRRRYATLFDRADIYVAFIEHGLEMLAEGGRLSFICTDRFTKNRYGKELRHLINENYRVVHFLDIHNTQPFMDVVSAYPCIFTIENGLKGEARTLKMDEVSSMHLEEARKYLLGGFETTCHGIETHTIKDWFKGSDPWVLNGERAQSILRKLEESHPLLTESPHNITVGIGVATGAKDIYIVHPEKVDIEPEVLLPTVTKDDIKDGYINWRGYYVINPYKPDGTLVNLEEYPKLQTYFLSHEKRLKERNTAKNNPAKWYKTIDRIFPERLKEPKLLIPDIKSENLIVRDDGHFYPEHSLYYITAGTWDIEALQALLTSSIIKFFIWSYATKMRGDYLRYQAQYLKKIRLPVGIAKEDIYHLKQFHQRRDNASIDLLAQRLFGLTDDELQIIYELVGREE
ncbi:Eco57I restriction-modification methylase domain-containing protein [Brevibacillus borstelensis]|uniref:Eco57I restriction-modification methylase domain-containing protein n=1 Tax=Brevibacillus borstelensis TaxID=45462 RepID=UPI00287FBD8C|nr:N-6 DNA methylase [Brevibacillus borstelensis]WNF06413.1 Eco57I restriction-modification methylase domain-containing protein [Brevibacillus borstelensis]